MRLLHRILLIAVMFGLAALPLQPSGFSHEDRGAREADVMSTVVVADHNIHDAVAHCADHGDHANCLLGCCGPAWMALPAAPHVLAPAAMHRVMLVLRPSDLPREWSFRPSAPPPKLA